MAKVFISYSHKDEDLVNKLIDSIDRKKHDVLIDRNILDIGDPINTELKKNIQISDYVLVFLSSSSVKSKWVKQEIYETLYLELKAKRLKLIPIVIEKCDHENIFKSLKTYDRFYSAYLTDPIKSVAHINETICHEPKTVFVDENYLRLDINYPNLEIYMVGDLVGWEANSQLRYNELVDGYLLFGFHVMAHTYFKHFVLCELNESKDIRDKLVNSNLNITGTGDIDINTRKRRVWFSLRNFPVEGPSKNNVWNED